MPRGSVHRPARLLMSLSMHYPQFKDVAALPLSALRHLLMHGDSRERVWAAWALGLHHQGNSAPALEHAARKDVEPGVRRHLVVMLAGAGERDPLGALCAHDSDAHVRATALQYLARLLGPAELSMHRFVVERLRADPSATVVAAGVRWVRADAPPFVFEAVEMLLQHSDESVRAAAVEKLLMASPTEIPPAVKSALRHDRQLLQLLEEDCRARVMHLFPTSPAPADSPHAEAQWPLALRKPP